MIRLTAHENGRATITGLTVPDLRLIAAAIGEGSWQAGDKGGPVSQALLRLEAALRVPGMYGPGVIEVFGHEDDPDLLARPLFEEPVNVPKVDR